MTDKENYNGVFEPVVIEYSKLDDINLVPEEIKKLLMERYQSVKWKKEIIAIL